MVGGSPTTSCASTSIRSTAPTGVQPDQAGHRAVAGRQRAAPAGSARRAAAVALREHQQPPPHLSDALARAVAAGSSALQQPLHRGPDLGLTARIGLCHRRLSRRIRARTWTPPDLRQLPGDVFQQRQALRHLRMGSQPWPPAAAAATLQHGLHRGSYLGLRRRARAMGGRRLPRAVRQSLRGQPSASRASPRHGMRGRGRRRSIMAAPGTARRP